MTKSKIHIKPENRGKFTAYKKRTGRTTEEALHSKDPHVRKMAQFAKNSRKWKKAQQGTTIPFEEWVKQNDKELTGHPEIDAKVQIEYNDYIDSLQTYEPPKSIVPLREEDAIYKKATGMAAYIPKIDMGPSVDESFKLAKRDLSQPTKNPIKTKKNFNWGNAAVTALGIADALIPNKEIEEPVVFPKTGYNPRQYGTGSQAIAQKGITISTTGYKANSKDRNKSKLRIPSNQITMRNVPHPVIGTSSDGQQIVMMPGEDYIFPNAEYVDEQPLAKKGKKIQGKYISKSYQSGGKMMYANDGINIEDGDYQYLSEDTLQLTGDGHNEGGQLISANGKTVEAEGGETMHRDEGGNVIVGGNLVNPLTNKKFKEDFKMIAKKEAKLDKLTNYSSELMKVADPYDKWGNLKFNAATAMMTGAKIKSKQLSSLKSHLTDMQEASIALKKEGQETAKNGLKIEKAQRGITLPNGRTVTYKEWRKYQKENEAPQLSNNQPFDFYNTPSSKLDPEKYLQAVYSNEGGETGVNPPIRGNASGKYALMPAAQQDVYNAHYKSKMSWDEFKKKYDTDANFEHDVALNLAKDKIAQYPTAAEAIGSWYNPASIKRKAWDEVPFPEYGNKISIRQYVDRAAKNYFAGTNQQNPNSIYSNKSTTDSPIDLQDVQLPDWLTEYNNKKEVEKPTASTVADGKYDFNLSPLSAVAPSGTDAEKLKFNQILPEIYAAATNKEEPVWLQQYNPELYQPYNVSFQDRRNRVTSQGRATRQYLADNANAQATLAAGEYDALSSIDAEEFRTNQAIASDITNKNKALLNEAQLKNLQLADLQYTRQTKAKSLTKATNRSVLDSVSNKILQNKLENRTLQVYENLYPHFRYDNNFQLKKDKGSNPEFNVGNPVTSGIADNTSIVKTVDPDGTLKQAKYSTKSALETAMDRLKLEDLELRNPLSGLVPKRKSIQGLYNIFR